MGFFSPTGFRETISVSHLVLTLLSSATPTKTSCPFPHIGIAYLLTNNYPECFFAGIPNNHHKHFLIEMIKLSSILFYSYSIIACTSEGCITSPHTNITTLEAPPATVEAPTVDRITSDRVNISWSKPLTQNGEVTEYVLKLNNEEAYRGKDRSTVLSDLQPHTSYQLVLLACTSGGCTTSATMSAVTEEAPPTGLPAPTLKVCLLTFDFQ